MAVTANWYGLGMKDMVCSGTVQLQGGVIGAALLKGYTFNQDTHHYLTSVMDCEVVPGGTSSGYTSFGATVAGSTVSYDTASNEVRWDINPDPSWPTATFSASQMVLYYRFAGGTTTNWPLLMYIEFGGTQQVTSGTFTYQVPATGAGVITVA